MTTSVSIQIRGKGTLTLPIELRRKYGLSEGDIISLIDLGDGSFVLRHIVTRVVAETESAMARKVPRALIYL